MTNAYPSISDEDAEAWLRPLAAAGVSRVSVSDDVFHDQSFESPAARLGVPCNRLTIEPPRTQATDQPATDLHATGNDQPVAGGVMFRGRAADRLVAGLPRRSLASLDHCPHEDLRSPARVHIDPYGYVHLCQGLVVGNINEHRLVDLIRNYRPASHPICRALVDGGPALLSRRYGVDPEPGYVDECHCCYLVRRRLMHRFPEHLAPPQIYGAVGSPRRWSSGTPDASSSLT